MPKHPMIRIQFHETAYRRLRLREAHDDTTIQRLVADLIYREVGEAERFKNEEWFDVSRHGFVGI